MIHREIDKEKVEEYITIKSSSILNIPLVRTRNPDFEDQRETDKISKSG